MGRVRTNIKVNNKDCWTLFERGSRNTYVVEGISTHLPKYQLPQSRSVALGGKVYSINTGCVLMANIQGLPIETDAYILNEIGLDEDGKNIEVLFGALAMQKWGICPIIDEERLDMSHYPKEFLEF